MKPPAKTTQWFSEISGLDLTFPSEGEAGSTPHLPLLRYEIGELIGRGAVGQVHRGRDRILEREIAIKFVRMDKNFALHQVRQELTALRGLDIPGILELIDDGVDGNQYFLVTEIIDGPGLREWLADRPDWEEVGAVFRALLITLNRLHCVGVIHRDLKPGNIRMSGDDKPVVLDFGLAQGHRVAAQDPNIVAGTRRYAPPEQWTGDEADARTDRYSFGVILRDWLDNIAHEPPGHLALLCEELCAPQIEDRPKDATEVLLALGGRAKDLWGEIPEDLGDDPASLVQLFGRARKTFRHMEEDLATQLHSQARSRSIREVILEWIHSGQVYWNGEFFTPCGPIRSPLHRTAAQPNDLGGVLDDCEALVQEGRVAEAQGALEQYEWLFRDQHLQPQMLILYTRVALELQSLRTMTLAQQHIECTLGAHPELRPYLDLLVGARAAIRGEANRAEAFLSRPLSDENLEILRQGYRGYVARSQGETAQHSFLEDCRTWAEGSALRQGALAGWRAHHAYRKGHWRTAATLHEQSKTLRTGEVWRLAAQVNAAQAWLDVPDFERADRLSTEAMTNARALRHAAFEARSTWIQRAAGYRAGGIATVELEWVDAAAELNDTLLGLMALNEAAIGWRYGSEHTFDLAERSWRAFTRRGNRVGGILAQALMRASEGGRQTSDEALAKEALACPVPEMGLQTLALLPYEVSSRFVSAAQELANSRPASEWDVCLDVMSVREGLERLTREPSSHGSGKTTLLE